MSEQGPVALREEHASLRTVLDPVPVGVLLFDPRGVPVVANRAARDLLGDLAAHPLDRWVTSRLFWLPSGEVAGAEDLPPCQTLRDGTAHVEAEISYQRWSTRSIPLLVSSRGVLDPEGNLTQVACSLTPIAEQCRRRERENRRSRLLALGSLAGTVAGPLNDTLTAIAGYVELAQERLDETDPLRKTLTQIHEAQQRAALLVGRLQSYGQREVAAPRTIDLDRWLGAQLPALAALLGDHIRLDVEPGAEGRHVRADPRMLQQVLVDLLANARDAMPRGGSVRLSTGPADTRSPVALGTAGETEGTRMLSLSVADTGGGMQESVLRRSFEPFYTTRPGALGLGLATVDRLTRAQGGALRVENRRGEGVTFHVHLPEVKQIEEAVPVEDEDLHCRSAGRPTALLVEDDLVVRDLVRQVLFDDGFHVLEARNCTHALRLLDGPEPREFDLLVCDIVMPGEGGQVLARELRSRHPGLPVLFVSGYSDPDVLAQVLSDPKTDFLPKPFTNEVLRLRARALLGLPSPLEASRREG